VGTSFLEASQDPKQGCGEQVSRVDSSTKDWRTICVGQK